MTDNDLPEGIERQDSEPASASSASPSTPQYGPNSAPDLTYSNGEDLETQDAATGTPQASTAAQDEEFDFDGEYFYNDFNTFMQEAVNFLLRHPEVRGAVLQEFHRQLLERSELVIDLDELEKLLE